MSNERCETCRFWHNYFGGDNEVGECRRYPPKPHPSLDEPVAIEGFDSTYEVAHHAFTWAVDWCGEYQPVRDTVSPPEKQCDSDP